MDAFNKQNSRPSLHYLRYQSFTVLVCSHRWVWGISPFPQHTKIKVTRMPTIYILLNENKILIFLIMALEIGNIYMSLSSRILLGCYKNTLSKPTVDALNYLCLLWFLCLSLCLLITSSLACSDMKGKLNITLQHILSQQSIFLWSQGLRNESSFLIRKAFLQIVNLNEKIFANNAT